ncbi:hypothetical protein WMY93_000490 [Mugilogobius chulae]|uniref:Uncharacterized protein n=1 Tax=Mugilogobius chulae TaxID=88201 RepID=A0AAW0Q2L4_9GOBI
MNHERSFARHQRTSFDQTTGGQTVREGNMQERIQQMERNRDQRMQRLANGAESWMATTAANTNRVSERMAYDQSRWEQIQEQENRRLAAVSKHAEDLLAREAARNEQILKRMGLQNMSRPSEMHVVCRQQRISRIPTLKPRGEVKKMSGCTLPTALPRIKELVDLVQRFNQKPGPASTQRAVRILCPACSTPLRIVSDVNDDDDLPEPSKPSGRPPRQENRRPLKHRAPESHCDDQQGNMETNDDDDEASVPSRRSGPSHKRRPHFLPKKIPLACPDEIDDDLPEPSKPSGRPPRQENCRP